MRGNIGFGGCAQVVCAVGLLGVGSSGALGGRGGGADPVFVEEAAAVGLTHVHASVQGDDRVLEYLVPGGAVGDFDRDGDQDLFVVGGSGGVDMLYWNTGAGVFVEGGAAAGVALNHRGSGACVGDYDNDGDLDIYVTSHGVWFIDAPHQNRLYRNNGDGTFTDVAFAAGVATNHPGAGDAMSASFGDYDLDGDLDLAVAGWYGGNVLFQNNGDGTFTNVTADLLGAMWWVRGFTPRFVDMDGDRWPELLWVADFGTSRYFVNNGDGTFSDWTTPAGVGLDSNGMGTTVGDVNNDSEMDWYVASIKRANGDGSGNMLYMGSAKDHEFDEVSVAAGVNNGYWCWGTVATDFDQDGWLDLLATNGSFEGQFAMDPTLLFMNNGDGTFTERANESGIVETGQGRGMLDADLDNDGDRDALIFRTADSLVYLRNDTAGGGAITLSFDTSGVAGLAPDGFGVRVEAVAGTLKMVRVLDGGSNYLSQSELSVHLGIGDAERADLVIRYPDGSMETLVGVRPGRYTITARECVADFSGDGALDFFDLSAFLMKLTSGHPQADLSMDGEHDFFDVSSFLMAYSGGCP